MELNVEYTLILSKPVMVLRLSIILTILTLSSYPNRYYIGYIVTTLILDITVEFIVQLHPL